MCTFGSRPGCELGAEKLSGEGVSTEGLPDRPCNTFQVKPHDMEPAAGSQEKISRIGSYEAQHIQPES